jgi:hypothetical protein
LRQYEGNLNDVKTRPDDVLGGYAIHKAHLQTHGSYFPRGDSRTGKMLFLVTIVIHSPVTSFMRKDARRRKEDAKNDLHDGCWL